MTARPNLSGSILGGVRILRRVGQWCTAVCACGEVWRSALNTLEQHERKGTVGSCDACRSRAAALATVGHVFRGNQHTTKARRGRHCLKCEGLPWRRDVPHCPKCHEPFEEEPPVTVADVLAQPRDNGRAMPEGGV